MKCEYCDSIIQSAPDDEKCPNCGGMLLTYVGFPKPPFSSKKVPWGIFELRKHSVRISLKHPKVPRKDVTIFYSDIYDASYVPATTWLKGFLCIRDVKKRNVPLPRKFGEHRIRDDIVWFEACDNDVFYQAYTYLKECAEINAEKAKNRLEQTIYPKPPFLAKKAIWDYVEFQNNAVKLSLKHPKLPRRTVIIPYNAIYDTTYIPPTFWRNGVICIRDVQKCMIRLPKNHFEVRLTDDIVWFGARDEEAFYQIYTFLKKCAEINAKIAENQ